MTLIDVEEFQYCLYNVLIVSHVGADVPLLFKNCPVVPAAVDEYAPDAPPYTTPPYVGALIVAVPETVKVLDAVPLAIVKPVGTAVSVKPL